LLKRIATAVVLIPIVLVLVLRGPIPLLAIVAGAVALATVYEFLKLTEGYGVRPLYRATYVFVILFFLVLALNPGEGKPLLSAAIFVYGVGFAACIAPFAFLTMAMRNPSLETVYPAAAAGAFAFVYIALPLGFLVQLRQMWAGAMLVLYLLLSVWAGDILAYFVGKSLGRHLMAPRISPKKTWEGAAASLAAGLGVGLLLWNYALPLSSALLRANLIEPRDGLFGLERPPLWPVLLLSAGINIAAQLGDLVESLIKRGAGVKDSGTILPGHGGMLDRIDALLFATPVLWYWAAWRVMQ
jgi:phosphatidate cytidylyltransferase